MSSSLLRSVALSSASSVLALAGPAFAQAAEAPPAVGAEAEPPAAEIIVTANKRAERLQDVPIAVSVVSARQLASQNITSTADLVRAVPSLSGSNANASAPMTIRGIGTAAFSRSAEGSVGVVLDGVALGNTSAAAPQLFDLARVEVLEGPQGMLFGRNASAGLINVVTADPDPRGTSARFHADIGTRHAQIIQGVVNLPLGSDTALRVSGAFSRDPNKHYNVVSANWFNNHTASLRARLKAGLGDNVTINLIGDYNRKDISGGSPFIVYRTTGPNAGIGTPGSALDTQGSVVHLQLTGATCNLTVGEDNGRGCTDGPNKEDATGWGVSNQIDFDLPFATLTSITAYRDLDSSRDQDSDSMPVNVLNRNFSSSQLHNFSQEFRLTSPDSGLITYVTGLYYFQSNQAHSTEQAGKILFGLNLPVITTPLPPTHPAYQLYALYVLTGIPASFAGTPYSTILLGQQNNLEIKAKSYAAFGQATIHFSRAVRGIVGFRYGSEETSTSRISIVAPGAAGKFPSSSLSPISANAKDTYFSHRAGLQADFVRDVMGYVTYTRGYKGPSINDQISSPVAGGITVPLVVLPEIPHAWEVGLKASLFDKRVNLNVSLFHTRTTNFQAQFYDVTRGGFVFSNAPKLTSKGFEIGLFGKVSRHFSLNAGLIHANAAYGPGFRVQCSQLQTAALGCITDPLNSAVKYDDAEGNQLPFSPRWKMNLGGEVTADVSEHAEALLQSDVVHTSRVTFTSGYDPLASTGSHTLVGARVGLRDIDGKWGVSLWARNLFDERVPAFRAANPIVGFGGQADPQSYIQIFGSESYRALGVSVDMKF